MFLNPYLRDASAFMEASYEVSRKTPIIALKVGRSKSAAKSAVSHTGTIAGSDRVNDAAFEAAGILRVDELHQVSSFVFELTS